MLEDDPQNFKESSPEPSYWKEVINSEIESMHFIKPYMGTSGWIHFTKPYMGTSGSFTKLQNSWMQVDIQEKDESRWINRKVQSQACC